MSVDNNTALKKAGLKVTLPRLKILEVLQEPDNHHVSAEDLYKRLIDMGEEIGLATVYRVLNQFDDAGIVTRHNFEGGKSVFELTQQHHHDHLICLDCGKVIEFSDDSIEARQREIAAKHGIRLTNPRFHSASVMRGPAGSGQLATPEEIWKNGS
nr:ferric iron uptake transcriptional regulator [Pseudomonas sp. ALS1131]